LRVLMISDVFFPRVNGVSTSIVTFRRELERAGHRVILVAPDYGTGSDGPGGRVIRVSSRTVLFDPEDRMMRARHILRMQETLCAQAPDIVHIQTPFVAHYAGVRVARALGVPVVASVHTFFEEYFPYYVPMLPRMLTRAATRYLSRRQCNEVDGLVVPSRAMVEVLRGYGVRTHAEVIPTGVDREGLGSADGARFRRRYGIPAERPLLVHIGRIAFEKNIGFLIRMVGVLRRTRPDVLLIIAGEGPAQRHLHGLVAELGLEQHVRFLGYLDRYRELADCYAAADAFVFASRTETQGLVLLEAMALGVPVVSTSVMGTCEILGAGKGALVAEEAEEPFAAEVLRLLDDARLRRHLGAQAREYALAWSAPAFARRLVAFYEDVRERAGLGTRPAA